MSEVKFIIWIVRIILIVNICKLKKLPSATSCVFPLSFGR